MESRCQHGEPGRDGMESCADVGQLKAPVQPFLWLNIGILEQRTLLSSSSTSSQKMQKGNMTANSMAKGTEESAFSQVLKRRQVCLVWFPKGQAASQSQAEAPASRV